jgi:zinc protease
VTENSWDKLPHRRPGIGSIEQLDAARIEDARAFHEAYYGPDTATLIVSGNFDQKQLDAWVDRLFAPIPARSRKVPLVIAERDAPRTAPRTATMYVPNVPLPVIGTTWRVPGFSHPDMAAIEVLDQILTGGESSPVPCAGRWQAGGEQRFRAAWPGRGGGLLCAVRVPCERTQRRGRRGGAG